MKIQVKSRINIKLTIDNVNEEIWETSTDEQRNEYIEENIKEHILQDIITDSNFNYTIKLIKDKT